ncbi:MAG: HD domain-containing phosphohydrolase [Lachnospirales bacterium]
MFKDRFKMGKIPISRLAMVARIGVFLIITLVFLNNFSGYTFIDREFYDRLFLKQHEDDTYNNIVTITINDKTLLDYKDGKIPYDIYTSILNGVLREANSVVFTMVLNTESNSDSDKALSEAIKKHGSVVLPYIRQNELNEEPIYPYALFLNATDHLGFVEYEKGSDGYVRLFTLYDEYNNVEYPSLVYEALDASGYNLTVSEEKVTLSVKSTNKFISTVDLYEENKFFRLPLTSEYTPYASYELLDVYDGKVPYSAFAGKIVVIGSSFTGSEDIVETPVYSIHGVEYITACILSLIEGFNPILASSGFILLYAVILYVLVDLITIILPPKRKILVPIAFTILTFIISVGFAIMAERIVSIVFPTMAIWGSFGINFLFYILGSEKATEVYKIPTSSILQLSNIGSSDSYTFVSYLRVLEESILENSHISIEHVEMEAGHTLYKKYLSNNDKKKKQEVLAIDNYIFIPLTAREKKSNPYCVLKNEGNLSRDTIYHISAMILSADVYFKFSDEGKKKEKLYKTIIEKMVNAVDSKDPTMVDHSKRVSEYSVKIGKLLMFSEYDIERLSFVASIHDIGKAGIADTILYKPSFYSEDDVKEIQKHPVLGVEILSTLKIDKFIKDGILYHHESYDGSGYPEGLKGSEIPQVARILKIADVFDALLSERQYKKPLPLDEACNILYEGRGKEFDPEITDIFLESVKPKNWVPPKVHYDINKSLPNDIKVMATKYYNAYIKHISVLVDDIPIECEFSFNLSKGFCGLTFGNHFTEKNWLYTKPVCISVSKDEEEMIYFKQEYSSDRKFTYVFNRGYLTSGIVSSTKKIKDMEDYSLELHKDLGEPFYTDEKIEAWDSNKFYIINFIGQTEKTEHVTIYINKFIL